MSAFFLASSSSMRLKSGFRGPGDGARVGAGGGRPLEASRLNLPAAAGGAEIKGRPSASTSQGSSPRIAWIALEGESILRGGCGGDRNGDAPWFCCGVGGWPGAPWAAPGALVEVVRAAGGVGAAKLVLRALVAGENPAQGESLPTAGRFAGEEPDGFSAPAWIGERRPWASAIIVAAADDMMNGGECRRRDPWRDPASASAACRSGSSKKGGEPSRWNEGASPGQ